VGARGLGAGGRLAAPHSRHPDPGAPAPPPLGGSAYAARSERAESEPRRLASNGSNAAQDFTWASLLLDAAKHALRERGPPERWRRCVPLGLLPAGESNGSNVPDESNGSNVPDERNGSNVPDESNGSNVPGESNGSNVPGESNGSNVPGESNGSNVPDESNEGWAEELRALQAAVSEVPPPPPARTNWTRLVPSSRNNWTRPAPTPLARARPSRALRPPPAARPPADSACPQTRVSARRVQLVRGEGRGVSD